MSKGLKELIEKFESKKEFFEVKIKTRQSFREDQAALEHRLSKYRTKSIHEKEMSNGDANGHVDNGTDKASEVSVEAKLETIVLDIPEDSSPSVHGHNTCESESTYENMDFKNDLTFNGGNNKNDTNSTYETITPHVSNGQEHSVPGTNGVVMDEQTPAQTNTKVANEVLTNGHVVRQKETSSLINRPKISVSARAAVTPESRHKYLQGIYQKNPKLTPSSTDHLDNVSLTGFRVSGQSHGQKVESQRIAVPPVPSAEVTSLPADGNVADFSVEQMVTFFRLLRLPNELVYRLSQCKVDGKRFSVFSDKELKELGMCNPIIRYFRDRTAQRPKKRVQKFML